MANYSRQIKTAQSLIRKYGHELTFLRFQSETSVDASSIDWKTSKPIVIQPSYEVKAYGVELPYRGEKFGNYGIHDEMVIRSEFVFMVEAIDEPLTDFKVIETNGGLRYQITAVELLKPADDIIMYYFGAKR